MNFVLFQLGQLNSFDKDDNYPFGFYVFIYLKKTTFIRGQQNTIFLPNSFLSNLLSSVIIIGSRGDISRLLRTSTMSIHTPFSCTLILFQSLCTQHVGKHRDRIDGVLTSSYVPVVREDLYQKSFLNLTFSLAPSPLTVRHSFNVVCNV